MAVALLDAHAEALAAGLAPIRIVRTATANEAVTTLSSVLPLAVAVSERLSMEEIRILADLARTCASEIVVVADDVADGELLDTVFEVVRRSDARGAV